MPLFPFPISLFLLLHPSHFHCACVPLPLLGSFSFFLYPHLLPRLRHVAESAAFEAAVHALVHKGQVNCHALGAYPAHDAPIGAGLELLEYVLARTGCLWSRHGILT